MISSIMEVPHVGEGSVGSEAIIQEPPLGAREDWKGNGKGSRIACKMGMRQDLIRKDQYITFLRSFIVVNRTRR